MQSVVQTLYSILHSYNVFLLHIKSYYVHAGLSISILGNCLNRGLSLMIQISQIEDM